MSTEKSSAARPANPGRRRHIRTRWIVAAVLVALLAGVSGITWAVLRPKPVTLASGSTTVLADGPIVDSISATGVVAAVTSAKVYSSLAYQVQEVHVSEGQVVRAGDMLAQLDTATIDKQIATKRASMSQASASAAASLAAAQHKYDAVQSGISNGTNAATLNAQSAVTTTQAAWDKAALSYEQYRSALDDGQNSQLIAAQSAVDNARAALANATYNLQLAEDKWVIAGRPDYPDPLRTAFDQADIAFCSARTAYELAKESYDAVATATDDTLATYAAAVDDSYASYLDATQGVGAARASADNELQASLDGVRSSQAAARNDAAVTDLANLEQDLRSATITSPIDGTVTSVSATVGAPASAGVLFVVETTDALKIDASVKEYDVNTVKPGMRVLISSDATREAVYEGTLTSVAAASDKDAAGDTVTGSSVQYATTTALTSTGTGLRIGMNVRLQYVVQEQQHVLAVPYDAVYKNTWGSDAVLAVVTRPNGNLVLEEVPVTVGLQSDLDVAISGNLVREGLRVLNNPTGYQAGTVVQLDTES